MGTKHEWKKDDRMFHDGERLWLGDVPVAYTCWKAGTKGDPDSSGPRCIMELPGIAAKDLPHKSFDEAKDQAVRLMMRWIMRAGLEAKDDAHA